MYLNLSVKAWLLHIKSLARKDLANGPYYKFGTHATLNCKLEGIEALGNIQSDGGEDKKKPTFSSFTISNIFDPMHLSSVSPYFPSHNPPHQIKKQNPDQTRPAFVSHFIFKRDKKHLSLDDF